MLHLQLLGRALALIGRQTAAVVLIVAAAFAATCIGAIAGVVFVFSIYPMWIFGFFLIFVVPLALIMGFAYIAPTGCLLLPIIAVVVPPSYGLRSAALVVAGGLGGIATLYWSTSRYDIMGQRNDDLLLVAGCIAGLASGATFAHSIRECRAPITSVRRGLLRNSSVKAEKLK